MMNARENTLRAVRFEHPEGIPVSFVIGSGCWEQMPQEALLEMMADHPLLFPDFQRPEGRVEPRHPAWRRAGVRYTDSWGCEWETAENGITGAVVKHAVPDWEAFDRFEPPSPEEQNGWGPVDWERVRASVAKAREAGQLARGGLRHGHTFLTLTYLRGYEPLILDMCDEHPRLMELIEGVEAFNLGIVRRCLEAGVEWMGYPEDLGMQQGPLISPGLFRRYIKPSYERLIAPAREAGCVIHMHSDGDIRALAEDLLGIGVDVLNLQDRVNGIDWIEAHLKGRVCIDLDIDRQEITRFGSPEQIRRHIQEAVNRLGCPEGGLMLTYGLYPGVPVENAKAVMDGMEACAGGRA